LKSIQKYVVEFIGTMILIFFGCGSIVGINNLFASDAVVPIAFSTLLIALSFGLSLTILKYTIGDVSGCHINPAVSIGFCIYGKMKVSECIKYVVSQLLGGIVGAAILVIIFNNNIALSANGFSVLSPLNTTWHQAFLVETILTTIFVFVFLDVSQKKKIFDIGGLMIGLTLTLIHIFGIPFTGTSVNPARSLGTAIFTGGIAIEQVWLFLLAPSCGAVLAGLLYKYIFEKNK